jgi:ABC-type multidrug transport system fused ATPase/permease subunit
MYGEVLQRKANVMNAEELTKDFIDESFTNHVLPTNWKQLEIKGLTFSYANGEPDDVHLNDISLSITRGEHIAFVGESGSGKTTLLKIMRDLYHPQQLQLSVDGNTVDTGFEGIRQAIALVPQMPEIFASTIMENITLGAEYEIGTVKYFTDLACFTEVVEKLPLQFNTSMKERGVNLSGGQQQRLALTRGLLACQDKDIVLLDEPTSSLDGLTEMRVYQNILKEFADKTIISTIHHLHLLPLFDKIYVFDQGKIVGCGSLQHLISSHSKFQELWRKSVVQQ